MDKKFGVGLLFLGFSFPFLTYATLLGGEETIVPQLAPQAAPIEMPPYQSEYPDAIPEQETAVEEKPELIEMPEEEPIISQPTIVPTEPVEIGAGIEATMVPTEENVEVIKPLPVRNILNPNIQEKKKEVPIEALPEPTVERTGLVDPRLWQKGKDEARRKVEQRIESAQRAHKDVIAQPETPETEELKEKNIFLRFIQRLTNFFGK